MVRELEGHLHRAVGGELELLELWTQTERRERGEGGGGGGAGAVPRWPLLTSTELKPSLLRFAISVLLIVLSNCNLASRTAFFNSPSSLKLNRLGALLGCCGLLMSGKLEEAS